MYLILYRLLILHDIYIGILICTFQAQTPRYVLLGHVGWDFTSFLRHLSSLWEWFCHSDLCFHSLPPSLSLSFSFSITLQENCESSEMASISSSNTNFALDLFRILSQANPTGNVFVSPLSISSALAMVYLGAQGDTAAQMAKVSTPVQLASLCSFCHVQCCEMLLV